MTATAPSAAARLAESHRHMTPEHIASHAIELADLLDLSNETLTKVVSMNNNLAEAVTHAETLTRRMQATVRQAANLAQLGRHQPALEMLVELAAIPMHPATDYPPAAFKPVVFADDVFSPAGAPEKEPA